MLPLPNPLLALAEIGSNRLLALDEAIIQRCSELQGRCVAIEFTDLELTLYCHPGNWGIRLSQEPPANEIDATIAGRLFALLNLSIEDDKISTSIRERVSINGDARVAQQMQKIITDIDIDWEEVLSQYTGDVLAFQIHQQVRKTTRFLQQGLNSLMQTNSEYLREEARLTPHLAEFERFQKDVTAIKHDVDRTEARVRRLSRTLIDNKKT